MDDPPVWWGSWGGHWRRGGAILISSADVDPGVVREAQVAAEMINALHATFAGVRHERTLVNVFAYL